MLKGKLTFLHNSLSRQELVKQRRRFGIKSDLGKVSSIRERSTEAQSSEDQEIEMKELTREKCYLINSIPSRKELQSIHKKLTQKLSQPSVILEALINLRVTLSTQENQDNAQQVISMILDSDILRHLCTIFKGSNPCFNLHDEKFQELSDDWCFKTLQEARNEILWIFINITSQNTSKQSKILRRRGIADAVISQLNSEDIDLVSSAIFCLGNIVADGG